MSEHDHKRVPGRARAAAAHGHAPAPSAGTPGKRTLVDSPATLSPKAGGSALHPALAGNPLTIKRPIHVGDVRFELELKAELQVKGSVDLTEKDLMLLEGKLETIGHKVGFAFLKDKEKVELFPHVNFQLTTSLAEMTLDGKGTNLKLGKIGIGFQGEASELLAQSGLSHLDGKVQVEVSGTLSYTILDARDALAQIAEHHLKGRLHAEAIAEKAKHLAEARELERQEKRLTKEIQDLRRFADRLDSVEREERLRLRGQILDKQLELMRQRTKVRDALRSKGQVERILYEIAEDVRGLDESRHAVRRLTKTVKSKAGQAIAHGMSVMSRRLVGRLLLKALPVIGWALTIVDIKDAAVLIKDLAEEFAETGVSFSWDYHEGGGAEEGTDEELGKSSPIWGSSEVPGKPGKPGGAGPGGGEPIEEEPRGQEKAPYQAKAETLHPGAEEVLAMLGGGRSRFGADWLPSLNAIVPEDISGIRDALWEQLKLWPADAGEPNLIIAALATAIARARKPGREDGGQDTSRLNPKAKLVFAMLAAALGKGTAQWSPEELQRLDQLVVPDLSEREMEELQRRLSRLKPGGDIAATLAAVEAALKPLWRARLGAEPTVPDGDPADGPGPRGNRSRRRREAGDRAIQDEPQPSAPEPKDRSPDVALDVDNPTSKFPINLWDIAVSDEHTHALRTDAEGRVVLDPARRDDWIDDRQAVLLASKRVARVVAVEATLGTTNQRDKGRPLQNGQIRITYVDVTGGPNQIEVHPFSYEPPHDAKPAELYASRDAVDRDELKTQIDGHLELRADGALHLKATGAEVTTSRFTAVIETASEVERRRGSSGSTLHRMAVELRFNDVPEPFEVNAGGKMVEVAANKRLAFEIVLER